MAQRKPGPAKNRMVPDHNPTKPARQLELGRDGISSMVDTDRALRAREVMGVDPTEPRTFRTLLERIEGRPAAD
jgi:hypothetical protein